MIEFIKKNLYKFNLIISLLYFNSCDTKNEYIPVANPEFKATLSELNLFKGNLNDLIPIETVHLYNLQTPLFSDYSEKSRYISIPQGESMQYIDNGLPTFPNKTILVKNFYYYHDNRNENFGKKIIETRISIKLNNVWEFGNYIWNDEQTEAYLNTNDTPIIKPISYINQYGNEINLDYEIPSNEDCIKCHQINNKPLPIGPKLRNLHNENQLQHFINIGLILGITNVNEIEKLPIWNDHINYNLNQRARAYLDVNCAHCHQTGGYYNLNHIDRIDMRYELDLADTDIEMARYFILIRMGMQPMENGFMPETGTTIKHEEGFRLISEYVNSL